jgi:hypothetical protein
MIEHFLSLCKGGNMLLTNQIKIARNMARLLSLALFLLWGVFFVEHLTWFFVEVNNSPPVHIWLAQISHFLLLIGYLITLKWERIGSVFVVVNALLFFGFAAGVNAVPFIIVSSFPVMLFAFCWMKEKKNNVIAS